MNGLILSANIKAHPHSAGARGGNQVPLHPRGLNSKLHLAVDSLQAGGDRRHSWLTAPKRCP